MINTVVFMFMHDFLHTVLVIDNTIAFIVSNLASFWFNHKAVFTKNVDHEHKLWQKLLSFLAYRIISLLPDTLIMWLGMTVLGWPALIVKVIDQILVGIFNYLTTKSVFEKQEKNLKKRLEKKIKKAVKLSFTAFFYSCKLANQEKSAGLGPFCRQIPGNII